MNDTRERLVDAALATIKAEGYGGSTARAIAGRAGVNQAVIYYHFGDVKNLLLAALDATSQRRMTAYRAMLEETRSVEDLVRLAREIYREDLAAGHVTVLAELIAGSLRHKELGPRVKTRLAPWVDFAEEAIRKVTAGTALEALIPSRDLASAAVAFYLGIDMLHQLDPEPGLAERLFDHAERLSPALAWVAAFGTVEEEKS